MSGAVVGGHRRIPTQGGVFLTFGGDLMRMRLGTIALAGILAIGGGQASSNRALAQCGGGGYSRSSGVYGGHTFGQGTYAGSSAMPMGMGMGMASMPMGGMCMGSMPMGGMQNMNMADMQGMNMGANTAMAPAAPTALNTPAAPAQYYCPMHPSVVSSRPGTCPYCRMPLRPLPAVQGKNRSGGTAAVPAAPAPAAPAQYYCPMHPDVVSSRPGTCPYCQMALRRR